MCRGGRNAKVTVGINNNPNASRYCDPANAGNIRVLLSSLGAEADCIGFGGDPMVANVDIVTARGQKVSCLIAQ